MTHEEFNQQNSFPALDGLRAVAVFLVFSVHFGGEAWAGYSGWLGVQLFFVLSGFLITTLLLRERSRTGTIDVRAFYVRRFFRIVPLLALVIVAVLVQTSLAQDHTFQQMKDALPYYLTFMNEAAPLAPLKMTWTLGIEWKFYLFWPVLFVAFGTTTKSLIGLVATCLCVLAGAWFSGVALNWTHPYQYMVMLMGAAIAIGLRSRTIFDLIRPLTSSTAAVLGVAVLAVLHVFSTDLSKSIGEGWLILVYGAVATLVLPSLLARSPLQQILASRALVFIGRRSYAMYLIQLMAAQATMGLLPWVHFSPLFLPFCFAVALVASDFLHRAVEQPMIRVGHRLAGRKTADRVSSRPKSATL